MTKEQKNHIEGIVKDFCKEAVTKYEKGQIEHGGNLWEKAVWKQTMPEAIDFVIYIYTLNEQIRTLINAAEKANALLELAYPDIYENLKEAIDPFKNERDTPEN